MLRVESVYKSFGNQRVIADFSMNLKKGDIVGITGETGSGKSTLLNIVSGYEKSDKGEIFFSSKPYSKFKEKEVNDFRKKKIAFMFQKCNLIEEFSVEDNIKLSLSFDRTKYHKIDEYLKKTGLLDLKKQKVSKLSGGEKQRVALIRALVKDFEILVCDEPTGSLDDTNSKIILDLIKEECANKIVIIVSHKSSVVDKYCNCVYHYSFESMKFIQVKENSVKAATETSSDEKVKLSVFGLLSHGLSRLKSKPVHNVMMLLLSVCFLLALGARAILSDSLFREIQVNEERMLLPLEQVVVSSGKADIDELLNNPAVDRIELRHKPYDNFKILGVDYIASRPLSPGDDTSKLNEINVYFEGKFKYNIYSQSKIGNMWVPYKLNEISSQDSFEYSDLIVGDYPEGNQILLDVNTAINLINVPEINFDRYINGKITVEEIFKNVRGRYIEVFDIRNCEAPNCQNIYSKGFEISGILDSKHLSPYLEGVYATKEVAEILVDSSYGDREIHYVIYKKDATKKINDLFFRELPHHYIYDKELIDEYNKAYKRIQTIVDYNIFVSTILAVSFFIGYLLVVAIIFSYSKADIAIYRSLGYSKFATSLMLSLSYIFLVLFSLMITAVIYTLFIKGIVPNPLYFTKIFLNGIVSSSLILFASFLLIMIGYVKTYSSRSINSLL
jgi:ABC-type lipoprotein export system ATPase subunit